MNYSSYPYAGHYRIDGRNVSHDEWMDHWRQHQRVGREQRDRYIEHLTQMYTDEYLTGEEFNDRHAKAVEAKFEFDLTSLVMDLPQVPAEKPKPAEIAVEAAKAVAVQSRAVEPRRKTRASVVWAMWAFLSLTVLCVPDPIAAHLYHGLGNAPWGFAFPLIFGMLGTVATGFFAVFSWIDGD